MWPFKLTIIFVILAVFQFGRAQSEPATTDSPVFSGHQDNSWEDLQKEIGILKAKVDAEQAIVSELLENKKTNETKITQDQVNQLNQHDKKLQELTKEYVQKLNQFQLRYPEKGQAVGRQYTRKNSLKSDAPGKPTTIENRVQKINKKIKDQYRKSGDAETVEQIVRKIKEKKKQSDKTKPIDVTDKMTVVK